VLPIENSMKKPGHFLGKFGVLNIAMAVVISFYGMVGYCGYLKYGEDTKGSITLNLPKDP
jgi:Transmembrane amino acid transporter protein.